MATSEAGGTKRADPHLRRLLAKRDALYARINCVYDLSKDAYRDEASKETFLSSVATLDHLYAQFELIVDECNTYTLEINPKDVPNYQMWTSFEDLYCRIKRVVQQIEQTAPPTKEVASEMKDIPKSQSRLPPIELVSFDGDIRKWPLFYQQFKDIIHNNTQLSNSERVHYLISKLSGKALSVCTGISPTAENYNIIWEALIDKFENTRSLASSYLDQLLNFKPLTVASANGLELFIENFTSAVKALQQLKINDLLDFIFLHLAMKKVDKDTNLMFEMFNRSECFPTYSSFVRFVKEQSRLLPRSSPDVNKSVTHSRSQRFNTKSFITTGLSNCILCHKPEHEQLYKCPQFVKMTQYERYKFVRDNAYCNNCLSTRHKYSDCNSQGICNVCSRKHHTMLHFSDKNNGNNNSFQANNLSHHISHVSRTATVPTSLAKRTHFSQPAPINVSHTAPALTRVSHTAPVRSRISHTAPTHTRISDTAHTRISHTAPAHARVSHTAPTHNIISQSAPAPTLVSQTAPTHNLVSQTAPAPHEASSSICNISRSGVDHHVTTTLLGTAKLKVMDKFGRQHFIRCLLDPGSQSDYISMPCCERLSLTVSSQARYYSVCGIGGTSQKILGVTSLTFTSRHNKDVTYSIKPLVVPRVTGCLPDAVVDCSRISLPANLLLADNEFGQPGDIDVLLGVNMYTQLILSNKIMGSNDSPTAIETTLGYVLMGDAPINSSIPTISYSHCGLIQMPLNRLVENFWRIEELPQTKHLSPEDERCEQIYASTTTRDSNGRYCVHLPFIDNRRVLGDSYGVALRRFTALERRFTKSPDLHLSYNSVIEEYLSKGYLSLDDHDIRGEGYYIPHHPVIRNDKTTTKLRIVLDASAKTDTGVSLNDILHTGCNLQTDIFHILLNVRLFRIAFVADVRQMYLSIIVDAPHRKYQKILYRFSANDPIRTYHFNRVAFGLKSSPFLALRTLRQLAEDERDNYPLAAKVIERDIYMDDLASSACDVAQAELIAQQSISLFKAGGFDLIKWTSNSPELLSKIPTSHRQETITFDNDHQLKILGLQWLPVSDVFTFTINTTQQPCTKRNILSATARLYDVLGLVGPVVLYAKLLIQQLWLLNIDWDDTPPHHIVGRWHQYVNELPLISQLDFPRHYGIEPKSRVALLAFADASEKAYGCVVYLRVVNGTSPPVVTLVGAKSRVAPVKVVTLARLELCAAVLLSKLVRTVYNCLSKRYPIDDIFAFSDSTVALSWIHSSPHRFHTFVANRIADCQENLDADHFYHVSGVENPADCLSRGLMPSQFINHALWFHGPQWVSLPRDEWPITPFNQSGNDMPEQKSVTLAVVNHPDHPLLTLASRFSNYNKLLRTIVIVLRFLRKLPLGKLISAADVSAAELVLTRAVQQQCFSDEISILRKGNSCTLHSLRTLSPFIHEGILRVGGRLRNSSLESAQKHQILLPRKGHVVELIIDYFHRKHLHAGPQLLLAKLREKFWILSARRIVRNRIHKCNICFKLNPKQTFPPMADLPACRVNKSHAFTHTGVDYAGPLYITHTRRRGVKSIKSYLCLFVCLVTRAIHLELTTDLSSASFLDAFKRFISRRGTCKYMYSDNGTNFVSSSHYLKDLHTFLRSDDYYKSFSEELAKNYIVWKFNPPNAPHFGGIWEANIKSVKTHLFRVIGKQVLTYEEMLTLLTQIEALLNSRPLYLLSSDPSEPAALTPAHFLCSAPLESLPAADLADERVSLLSRFSLLDSLVQSYWKRFKSEYLHNLQTRQKWNTPSSPVSVGTAVLIIVANAPPLQWPLGVITRLLPGRDGVVRVVQVRTRNGTYERPVVRLCPLPNQ